MTMLTRPLICLLVLGLSAAALPGQRYKRYTNPEHGFRLLVPREMEIVPLEPNERQTLVKWVVKDDDTRTVNPVRHTVLVVRITRKAPVTGGSDPDKERERLIEQSARDAAIEQLNGGTTVAEFLERRSFKHELKEIQGKPVKSKNGEVYTVQGVRAENLSPKDKEERHVIRTYTIEDATDIFGLVALGGVSGEFAELVEAMARSLERGTFGAEEDDFYAGSELKGLDFRREVRKKLVKGWEAHDTENFIFVTSSRNKKVIGEMLTDLEVMRKVYEARFPPLEPITAVSAVRFCEKYDDYLAYGGPPGSGGYWNYVDEELVLADLRTIGSDVLKNNPNLKNISPEDTLYHEAMHQYFFYACGHLAPGSWFGEGYGEYFGGTVVDRRKGEPKAINRNKFRMDWVMQSRRAGAWPDLPTFLKMSQAEFYGPSSLQNYAFAWAFCYFLEQHRLDAKKGNPDWAALPDRYLKNLVDITNQLRDERKIDPRDKKWLAVFEVEIQKQAYEATFQDVDLAELEKAWIEAMKKWR